MEPIGGRVWGGSRIDAALTAVFVAPSVAVAPSVVVAPAASLSTTADIASGKSAAGWPTTPAQGLRHQLKDYVERQPVEVLTTISDRALGVG